VFGSVGGPGPGSLLGAEDRAPVVADAWCRGLSHDSGKAGY